MKKSRWIIVSSVLIAGLISGFYGNSSGYAAGKESGQAAYADEWKNVPAILSRIRPPVFPKKDFKITDYGAVSGGVDDCSNAFSAAISACSKAGGGRVIVPEGIWSTGAIRLLSNVNLCVSKGAVIRFSRDLKKYLPPVLTRYESVECMNFSPFVYAYNQKNIAVTGEGTLDGQADANHWWNWKREEAEDNASLKDMAKNKIPAHRRIFAEGHKLRVNFIEPYQCKNVLIEGITIVNSPMWCIEPVQCTNVIVQKVTVSSHGPNNDGCDPQSCADVLIKDCNFNTGDDCIAIKAGRDDDGRFLNIPCKNIVIQGCRMKDGHGGITIGSETSGGIYNVFAENCTLDSPDLWMAVRLKTNSIRGGTIENINIRNITVGKVRDAVIHATMYYEPYREGDRGGFTPVIRNIAISDITSEYSACPVYLEGYERSKISNVIITGCRFDNADRKVKLANVSNITFRNTSINKKAYEPELK